MLQSTSMYSDHQSMPTIQSPVSTIVFFPFFLVIFSTLANPNPGMLDPGLTGSRYDFAPEIQVLNSGSELTQQILIMAKPSGTTVSSISPVSTNSKQERSWGKSLVGQDFRTNFLNLIGINQFYNATQSSAYEGVDKQNIIMTSSVLNGCSVRIERVRFRKRLQLMGCGAVNAVDSERKGETVLTLNRIYERKELIGSGTYGKVYRCINKLNGQEYALKVVEITAKTREEALKQINNLKAEIGVLKKLAHENIVKYYSFDISNDSKQVEIVLEYAKKGSLKQYIQERDHLSEREAAGMTAQILKGLCYLHQQNIVHRDLKCANILIMEDGTLKISDFGTAKAIKISSNEDIAKLCSSLKGTPYYMAPEVLRRTGHGVSADIWSLGCLVIEMVSGKAPWTSLTLNFEEIISYIVTGIHPPFPKGLSEECGCFLESCLDNVPSQRLTAEELLKHRWIDPTSTDRPLFSGRKEKNFGPTFTRAKELVQNFQLQEQQPTKKELKDRKQKQIDIYISQRSNVTSKRKLSSQKNSNKQKKDRSASIKAPESDLNLVEEEIEITPHIDLPFQQPTLPTTESKPKDKREDILRITKTAPQMKLTQEVIQEIKEIQDQRFEVLSSIKEDVTELDKTRLKTDASKQGAIDTHISREQRQKYIEMQRQMREQRQEQRRRWQQELKQGADYLRKQITNRYQI